MHHQQRGLTNHAYHMPPLLAIDHAIFPEHQIGSAKTREAVSKSTPKCFCWFVRFLSVSHSKRMA